MHKILSLFLLPFLFYSCVKEVNPVIDGLDKSYLSGPGLFVLNEGNFRGGNGSLSYFSYDSVRLYNHVFQAANERPLGDIPYSMAFNGTKAYIVVNNSGKIEVVNRNNMKSDATIENLSSPRYISFVSDSKAYVTSLYSDSVAVINLLSNSVTGYINIKKTSESIITLYATAYVANWAGGNKIMVINTATDQVVDSIEVGYEPESMVLDWNETLWVLCNGGWKREHSAELLGIDTRSNEVIRRFVFPSVEDSPTCLRIDKEGRVLYFLLNGVRRMNIDADALPSQAFIPQLDHIFYKVGINPLNDEIFVTDVVDYVQKGKLIRYRNSGALISEYQADIIPGSICFKEFNDSVIE
jgi:YVTN family beta-propeller protein